MLTARPIEHTEGDRPDTHLEPPLRAGTQGHLARALGIDSMRLGSLLS